MPEDRIINFWKVEQKDLRDGRTERKDKKVRESFWEAQYRPHTSSRERGERCGEEEVIKETTGKPL